MINISEVKGAVFDLDDTLLDNGPTDKPALWLHSRSRLAAIHEVGHDLGITQLEVVTPEENGIAFTTAATHSLGGAIWNVFYMKGLSSSNDIDAASPLHQVAEKIASRKNELHESILNEFGVEIPGASDFIRALASQGLANYLALGTSAIKRDIDIFIDKYRLKNYFPDERIISAEKVYNPKPHPECFDKAFLSLGLPESDRRNVLAFEDNPRGIESAKAAGLYVCALTTRLSAGDPAMLAAKPDVIAGSFDEYGKLLGLQN